MKYSMIEAHEAGRDNQFFLGVLNDLTFALIGYFSGHLIACDYIYKHRQYILERLYFERQNSKFIDYYNRYRLQQRSLEFGEPRRHTGLGVLVC